MNHATSFKFLIIVLVVILSGSWTYEAHAISTTTRDGIVNGTRLGTRFGLVNPLTELTIIGGAYAAWFAEQKLITPIVGQAELNGIFPVSDLSPGTAGLLTFHFIDPATQLIAAGPSVASVRYEFNIDPSMPDTFAILGSSSDAASGFSVPITIGNTEPFFRAIPLNATGSPIFIGGVDNLNVAIGTEVNVNPIPEPSTLALLGIGASVLVYLRRRQERAGDSPCA